MNLYISIPSKIKITDDKKITLKDIAKIKSTTNNSNLRNIENIPLFSIKENNRILLYIDIITIIGKINSLYPKTQITSVGENECIIEWDISRKEKKKIIELLKVILVSIVLFTGGMTAIISFHTETELILVLSNIHEIITGETITSPLIIGIPYSLGIGVGIIIFFNHIGSKNITHDPSPVEIEMSQYEDSVLQTALNKFGHKEGDDN